MVSIVLRTSQLGLFPKELSKEESLLEKSQVEGIKVTLIPLEVEDSRVLVCRMTTQPPEVRSLVVLMVKVMGQSPPL